MKRSEVERDLFFKGWPEPMRGYTCVCRPEGDWGAIDVAVVMVDGKKFRGTFPGAMRSPHSSDVLQLDFGAVHTWSDGTAMTAVERRQVAMIVVWTHESQLYASELDQAEKAPS